MTQEYQSDFRASVVCKNLFRIRSSAAFRLPASVVYIPLTLSRQLALLPRECQQLSEKVTAYLNPTLSDHVQSRLPPLASHRLHGRGSCLAGGRVGDDRECAERGRPGNNSWSRDNVNRSECQRSDRLNHHDRAVNRLVNGKVTLVWVAANRRDRLRTRCPCRRTAWGTRARSRIGGRGILSIARGVAK